jgi:hypothetical protein
VLVLSRFFTKLTWTTTKLVRRPVPLAIAVAASSAFPPALSPRMIAPDPDPHRDWARHSLRVLDAVDNRVRSLRKYYLMDSYERRDHNATYWGIHASFADYSLPESDPVRGDAAQVQDHLMNWGYAFLQHFQAGAPRLPPTKKANARPQGRQ